MDIFGYKRFFLISDFLPFFGHKTYNSGHVGRSRDVILGGVVQYTQMIILDKVILIFGVMTKSPLPCYLWSIGYSFDH